MERRLRCVRRSPAGRASLAQVAPRTCGRRRRSCSRSGAEPAGTGRARRDPRDGWRRASTACALLASVAWTAPRHIGRGPLGRAGERLEAPPRPVPRGKLVAVRPLRRRCTGERARRARAGRRRAVDARPPGSSLRRAGSERRRIHGSRTSTALEFASLPATARAIACSCRARRGPIAWRPGPGFVLAHTTAKRVRAIDATTGTLLWQSSRPAGRVTHVEWSWNGTRVLVLSPHHLRVYDARGRLVDQESPAEGWPDVDAAFRPGTTEAAVARVHGSQSSAYILSGRRLTNVMGVVRERRVGA